MTLESVRAEVDRIRAMSGDDESAHIAEDALYEEFIRHVAGLNLGELSDMAKLVLSTEDIQFSRWYS